MVCYFGITEVAGIRTAIWDCNIAKISLAMPKSGWGGLSLNPFNALNPSKEFLTPNLNQKIYTPRPLPKPYHRTTATVYQSN